MSETIKIEIEIPAPPEGWGDVEFRCMTSCDRESKFWNGYSWVNAQVIQSTHFYPVARKITPLWTPPPQWHMMFGNCWVVVDADREVKLSRTKPKLETGMWQSDKFWLRFNWDMILPDMLPPNFIPWHKCCFKIGEPKE